MAKRVYDAKMEPKKGMVKGATYSNKEVGRMTKRTSKIAGSVLRKTSGLGDVLKLRGQKPTRANRAMLISQVKAGKGGFSTVSKRRGGGKRSTTP
jgi:hypothetical protein